MSPLRFEVFSFPVEIQPSFWIVALLLGWQGDTLTAVVWVAVLLLSIVLHELGHALAFRRFGHSPRIVLYALGGLTHGSPAPLSPLQRVAVSLAGPAAGFFSGLIALAASALVPTSSPLLAGAITMWLWVNLGWGLLNLLPIHPLDGSQALSGLLDWLGYPGRLGALWVSVPLSAVLLGLAAWGGAWWVALLTGWALYNAATSIVQHNRRAADAQLHPEIVALYQRLQGGAPPAACAAEGRALRARVRSPGGLRDLDTIVALAELKAGDPIAAADQLDQIPASVPLPDGLGAAVAAALHRAGAHERAAAVSTQLFREGRGAAHAYNVACALAQAGDEDGAVHWLQEAAAAGWSELDALDADPDLAGIRALPAWAALRKLLAEQIARLAG